jgi:PKD repeat protein
MKHLYLFLVAALFSINANAQCNAGFSYTNVGNTYDFTDTSTTASGNIVTWLWTFGDQTAPSTTQNPQHIYEICGTYVVTLNIFTSSFCSDSYSDTVYISNGFNPSWTYTVDTTNGNVDFQATPVSGLLNYSWDFGDSDTGTGPAPSHTYDSTGYYNVCLVVGDTGGVCVDTLCTLIYVYIAPATCNATFTNTLIGAGNETFNATPINFNWDYTWDFGDSSPAGNGFFTTHQYTASGTYTVCLTINDSATGCSSQFCDTVIILIPVACTPSFTANGFNGTYIFNASPFNLQNTYSWDFGDGSPLGTGFVANHTYITSGTYTVCLTMTTPTGCTETFCDTINVSIVGVNEQTANFPVYLFPNPATDELNLDFYLTSSATITVSIMDVSGRVLQSAIFAVHPGQLQKKIEIEQLAAGTYLICIATENAMTNQIFIKK